MKNLDVQSSLPKAVIIGLVPGSAAQKSGAQKGDVVLSFNGTPIKNMEDYLEALSNKQKSKNYSMEVLRGNEVLTLNVVSAPWNFSETVN